MRPARRRRCSTPSRRRCRATPRHASSGWPPSGAGGCAWSRPASSTMPITSPTRPTAASSARPTFTAPSPGTRRCRSCRAPTPTISANTGPASTPPRNQAVRHPYLEAGIDKRTVRALARRAGARRPQRTSGRALPVEPRRDRDRHPARSPARHPRHRARPRGRLPPRHGAVPRPRRRRGGRTRSRNPGRPRGGAAGSRGQRRGTPL